MAERNESIVLIPFIFISILALRKKTDGCRLTWMLYIQVGSGFTKPLDSYPREDANWFVSVTKNNECSYIDLRKMQTFFVQIQQFSNAAFT